VPLCDITILRPEVVPPCFQLEVHYTYSTVVRCSVACYVMQFFVLILHLIPDLYVFDAFSVTLAWVCSVQVRVAYERRFLNDSHCLF